MGDGVKVDDPREESPIPIGLGGPISDLLKDLRIASLRITGTRSVNQGDFHPYVVKRVGLNLEGTFFLLVFESNFYNRGLSYKSQIHCSLRLPSYR